MNERTPSEVICNRSPETLNVTAVISVAVTVPASVSFSSMMNVAARSKYRNRGIGYIDCSRYGKQYYLMGLKRCM